ncbi:hypothetical protein Aspvir_000445 [Aspergillus viridinutans]|uniref:Uncharacterized protein n=1 Tax=Aspergillus viridinutans TaxID=75553 RepID=A0A9P3F178_ASPVI|nr:uncharacterized protein Aspvir_000445 [Aspergillus viridinutans]GIJ98329.1 hypothetical protein Aspvir_000445 [Aspergillus viridinutans]
MGSWPGRMKDPNPTYKGRRRGDIRPSSTVELDLHTDPLGPDPGTTSLLKFPHRRLSQPGTSRSHDDHPERNSIVSRPLHGLTRSHSGSCRDTDADILPSPTNPTEHSDDLQVDRGQDWKSQASNQPSEARDHVPPLEYKTAGERLIEQLEDVSARRLRAREMRVALRYKREDEGNHRAVLMKRLNSLLAQDHQLADLIEELQSATESYLDLEQTYHRAEDELDQDEYVLIQSMQRFAKSLRESPPGLSKVIPQAESSASDFDAHSCRGEPLEYPPAVVDYLSRVGDARILQERLAELDSQWYTIVDKQRLRSSLNISLDEESLQFLRSYDGSRTQIRKELNETMLDIVRLRAICDERGLRTEEYTGEMDFLYGMGLEEVASQIEDPLKTSAIDDSSPFYEPGSAKVSSAMFINKWLLHQLRHSSVEISRLKAAPELQQLSDEGWDDANISRLALTVWFSDDTVRNSPQALSQADDYDYTGATETSKATRPRLQKSKSDPGITPKTRVSCASRVRTLSL